jgi:hypothetical protein
MSNKFKIYGLFVLFNLLNGCLIMGQTISPKQILPATSSRVAQPTKRYVLMSNPSDGGKFWYMLADSLTAGTPPQYTVPTWQAVTNMGRTTVHAVTAAGLTLTNLTEGSVSDSIITVREGLLRRIPPPNLIPVHQSNWIVNSDATTEDPLSISSNLGALPIRNEVVFRWLQQSATGNRQIVKDSQAIRLPNYPTRSLVTIDVMIQANIRKVLFLGSLEIPIDTMTQAKFQNVEHGSVFRCQMVSGANGGRWLIYKITNTITKQDTVILSENRVVQLSEFNKQVFLSARTGNWAANNSIEFKLPKYPSDGQEIVLTNQVPLIPSNTEFRFTATGGYRFMFSNDPSAKIFAYDPLSINTTADHVFDKTEFQVRCAANTATRTWSCFLVSQ